MSEIDKLLSELSERWKWLATLITALIAIVGFFALIRNESNLTLLALLLITIVVCLTIAQLENKFAVEGGRNKYRFPRARKPVILVAICLTTVLIGMPFTEVGRQFYVVGFVGTLTPSLTASATLPASQTSTTTDQPSATATAAATKVLTPTSTPTSTASPTPEITVTPSAVPEPTPIGGSDRIFFISRLNQNYGLAQYTISDNEVQSPMIRLQDFVLDASLSHDNSKIAIVNSSDYIYIIDMQGDTIATIDPHPLYSNLGTVSNLSWNLDGTQLAYTVSYQDSATGESKFVTDYLIYDFGRNTTQRLFSEPGLILSADWSPQTESVIYVTNSAGKKTKRFSVKSGLEILDITDLYSPHDLQISPSGQFVAYTYGLTNRHEILVYDQKSKLSKIIASPTYSFSSIDWSPDEKWLVTTCLITSTQVLRSYICLIEIESSALRFFSPETLDWVAWASGQ